MYAFLFIVGIRRGQGNCLSVPDVYTWVHSVWYLDVKRDFAGELFALRRGGRISSAE